MDLEPHLKNIELAGTVLHVALSKIRLLASENREVSPDEALAKIHNLADLVYALGENFNPNKGHCLPRLLKSIAEEVGSTYHSHMQDSLSRAAQYEGLVRAYELLIEGSVIRIERCDLVQGAPWAVRLNGQVLSTEGAWAAEPHMDETTLEHIASYRFHNAQHAMDVARSACADDSPESSDGA